MKIGENGEVTITLDVQSRAATVTVVGPTVPGGGPGGGVVKLTDLTDGELADLAEFFARAAEGLRLMPSRAHQ